MRGLVVVIACVGCRFEHGVVGAIESDAAADALESPPGAIARWDMDETSGVTVHDSETPPLDLSIEDASRIRWSGGALHVEQPVRIWATASATKLVTAGQATRAFTIEAWLKPASPTQSGPARIVTVSMDGLSSSFTLGQESLTWIFRVRMSSSDAVGRPELVTPNVIASTPMLTHVVATYDRGTRVFYVDGVEVARDVRSGDLQWTSNHQPAIASEPNADSFGIRPWLGEIHRVVFYQRALSLAEVQSLRTAGV